MKLNPKTCNHRSSAKMLRPPQTRNNLVPLLVLLLLLLLLQLFFHSVVVVLTLVQTKQVRINIHNKSNTETQYKNTEHSKYKYTYKACSKKDRTFAIKTLSLILQHFKHCPLQSSPLYWRYTVPNVSSIVGFLPGTHFL